MTTRRTKKAISVPTESAFDRLVRADERMGVSLRLMDRAPWLDETNQVDVPWYYALEAIDKTGDKTQLLDLLESDRKLSTNIRHHIADLLRRYDLKRPHKRPTTPSYEFSDSNAGLWLKLHDMRDYVRNGMRVRDAAEKFANKEFSAATLEDAYQGRHGGFARALAAKQPKKPRPW